MLIPIQPLSNRDENENAETDATIRPPVSRRTGILTSR